VDPIEVKTVSKTKVSRENSRFSFESMPFFLQLPKEKAKNNKRNDKNVVFKNGTFNKRTKLRFIT
jgi:hypothetical protein